MITFGTEAGTGVTAVQEPVHRIEAHWDAKNFKVSITRSHVVVIKSNTTRGTGAEACKFRALHRGYFS